MAGKDAAYLVEIPACFQPFLLTRTGNIYHNLGNHPFSELEKLFLCQQLRCRHTNRQILLEPTYFNAGGQASLSAKALAERYSINLYRIKDWLKRHDLGLVCHAASHPPKKYDNEVLSNVKKRVFDLEMNREQVNDENACRNIMNEEYHSFLRREGKVTEGNLFSKTTKFKQTLTSQY